MRHVDTTEPLTLHQRALGWTYVLVAVFMIALGLSVFWIGPEPGDWGIIAAAVFCILIGLACLAAVVVTHRRAGQPVITLSSEGITFEQQAGGVVFWAEVTGLAWLEAKGQQALSVKITDTAHIRIAPSRAGQVAGKLDKAVIGSKALTIWQTQIETPLEEVAQLIAEYSTAHGGPNLREAA